MRGIKNGPFPRFKNLEKDIQHLGPDNRIDPGSRFVQQEQLRGMGQG